MPYLVNNNTSHLLTYQKLDGSEIVFNLYKQHTMIKKFELVFVQVNAILEYDVDLNVMYDELLTLLVEGIDDTKEVDFTRIQQILPAIMEKVDQYSEEFGYLKFSYNAPKKISEYKLHIDKTGYREIMLSSLRSKFICAPVTVLRDKQVNLIRYLYSYICREMIDSGTQFKLERIIDSIVLSTSAHGLDSKSQLWTFFSTAKGIDPQNLALRERNAVFYKGLPTIASGLNPVNWFVAMARTSVNFQMKDKINEVHIAFNAPIESCYENSADMLKVFIYEEVTSNRKLMKLFKEYPFALNLTKEYLFPITNWITAPFVSEVFNVANLNITHLINILLLNIFAYKFISMVHPDWYLTKMLTYRAAIKTNTTNSKYALTANNRMQYFTSRSLTNLIRNKIVESKISTKTIYTNDQLEELFKYALKTLLLFEYYDSEGNRMPIDPMVFTNEYILYIYELLTHQFDHVIEMARNYLKQL